MFSKKNWYSGKPRGELNELSTPNSCDNFNLLFSASTTAMSDVVPLSDSNRSSTGCVKKSKFYNENEEDQENHFENDNGTIGTKMKYDKASFTEDISIHTGETCMSPLTAERSFKDRLERLSLSCNNPTPFDKRYDDAKKNNRVTEFNSCFQTSTIFNEIKINEINDADDDGSEMIRSEVSSINELSVDGLNAFLKSLHQATEGNNLALSLQSNSNYDSESLDSKSSSQCLSSPQQSSVYGSDEESLKTEASFCGMMISNKDSFENEAYYVSTESKQMLDVQDVELADEKHIIQCFSNSNYDSVISKSKSSSQSLSSPQKSSVYGSDEESVKASCRMMISNRDSFENEAYYVSTESKQMRDVQDVESTGEKQSIEWIDSKEEDIQVADESGSKNTNVMANDYNKVDEPADETDVLTPTCEGRETLTRKTSAEVGDSIEKNACIISHEVEQTRGELSPKEHQRAEIASLTIDLLNYQQDEPVYHRSLFMEALKEASGRVVQSVSDLPDNDSQSTNSFQRESKQTLEKMSEYNAITLNLDGSEEINSSHVMNFQQKESEDSSSNLMKLLIHATKKEVRPINITYKTYDVDSSIAVSSEEISLDSSKDSDSDESYICPETEEELDTYLNHVSPFLTVAPRVVRQEHVQFTDLTITRQHSEDLLSLKYLDSDEISTESIKKYEKRSTDGSCTPLDEKICTSNMEEPDETEKTTDPEFKEIWIACSHPSNIDEQNHSNNSLSNEGNIARNQLDGEEITAEYPQDENLEFFYDPSCNVLVDLDEKLQGQKITTDPELMKVWSDSSNTSIAYEQKHGKNAPFSDETKSRNQLDSSEATTTDELNQHVDQPACHLQDDIGQCSDPLDEKIEFCVDVSGNSVLEKPEEHLQVQKTITGPELMETWSDSSHSSNADEQKHGANANISYEPNQLDSEVPTKESNDDVEKLVRHLQDEMGPCSVTLDEKIEFCFDPSGTSNLKEPEELLQEHKTTTGPELMELLSDTSQSSNANEQKLGKNAPFSDVTVSRNQLDSEVISNEDMEQLVHYLKDEIGQSLSLPLDEKIELCFDPTCTSLPEEPDQVQLTPTGPELMDVSADSSNVDEQKHGENANFRKEFDVKKQHHYETTAVESIYADQLVHLETLHVQKTTTGLKPEDVWIDNSYSSDEKIPSTCVKVDSSDNNTARNRLHTEDNIVTLNEEAAEPSVDHSLDETSQCCDFLTTSGVKELPFPPLVLDQSLIASDRIMQGHNAIQSDTDLEKEEMNSDKTRAFGRFPTTIINAAGLSDELLNTEKCDFASLNTTDTIIDISKCNQAEALRKGITQLATLGSPSLPDDAERCGVIILKVVHEIFTTNAEVVQYEQLIQYESQSTESIELSCNYEKFYDQTNDDESLNHIRSIESVRSKDVAVPINNLSNQDSFNGVTETASSFNPIDDHNREICVELVHSKDLAEPANNLRNSLSFNGVTETASSCERTDDRKKDLSEEQVETDLLETTSDPASELLSKTFLILESKEGPCQSEIKNLFSILEDSSGLQLKDTSMFQIMLVLSLSQSSEWSASLSSRFLSLIYNAANQNFKSWIDERDDIEEIGLLQYYFVLNQFAKARASLEASPAYGKKFANLVDQLLRKPLISLLFPAELLEQLKRTQTREIEDQFVVPSMPLWRALHSSINHNISEHKAIDEIIPPEHNFNKADSIVEGVNAAADIPFQLLHERQSEFSYSEGALITENIETTLVNDSLEIMFDSKNDNLIQSTTSFNQRITLLTASSGCFSSANATSGENLSEDVVGEKVHDTYTDILDEYFEPVLCLEGEMKRPKPIIPSTTNADIVERKSGRALNDLNQENNADFSEQGSLLNLQQLPSFDNREIMLELYQAVLGHVDEVGETNQDKDFLRIKIDLGLPSTQEAEVTEERLDHVESAAGQIVVENLPEAVQIIEPVKNEEVFESCVVDINDSMEVVTINKHLNFVHCNFIEDAGRIQEPSENQETFESCIVDINDSMEAVTINKHLNLVQCNFFEDSSTSVLTVESMSNCLEIEVENIQGAVPENFNVGVNADSAELHEMQSTVNCFTASPVKSDSHVNLSDSCEEPKTEINDTVEPNDKPPGNSSENSNSVPIEVGHVKDLIRVTEKTDLDKDSSALGRIDSLISNCVEIEVEEIQDSILVTENITSGTNSENPNSVPIEVGHVEDLIRETEKTDFDKDSSALGRIDRLISNCEEIEVVEIQDSILVTEDIVIDEEIASPVGSTYNVFFSNEIENPSLAEINDALKTKDKSVTIEPNDKPVTYSEYSNIVPIEVGNIEDLIAVAEKADFAEDSSALRHIGSLISNCVEIEVGVIQDSIRETEDVGIHEDTVSPVECTSNVDLSHESKSHFAESNDTAEAIYKSDIKKKQFNLTQCNLAEVSFPSGQTEKSISNHLDLVVENIEESILITGNIGIHADLALDPSASGQSDNSMSNSVEIDAAESQDSVPHAERDSPRQGDEVNLHQSESFLCPNNEMNREKQIRMEQGQIIRELDQLKTLEFPLSPCFPQEDRLFMLQQSESIDSRDIIEIYEAKFGPMEEVDESKQAEDFFRRKIDFGHHEVDEPKGNKDAAQQIGLAVAKQNNIGYSTEADKIQIPGDSKSEKTVESCMVENDDTVQSNDESITKNKLFYPAQYNTADDSSPSGQSGKSMSICSEIEDSISITENIGVGKRLAELNEVQRICNCSPISPVNYDTNVECVHESEESDLSGQLDSPLIVNSQPDILQHDKMSPPAVKNTIHNADVCLDEVREAKECIEASVRHDVDSSLAQGSKELSLVESAFVESLDSSKESEKAQQTELAPEDSSLPSSVKYDMGEGGDSSPRLEKNIAEIKEVASTINMGIASSTSSFIENETKVSVVNQSFSLARSISGFDHLKTLECALSTCFSEETCFIDLNQSLSSDSQDMIQKFEAKFGPMEEVDLTDQAEEFLRRCLESNRAASTAPSIQSSCWANGAEEIMTKKSGHDQEVTEKLAVCMDIAVECKTVEQTLLTCDEKGNQKVTLRACERPDGSSPSENAIYDSLLTLAEKDELQLAERIHNSSLAQTFSKCHQLKTLEDALSTCPSQDCSKADSDMEFDESEEIDGSMKLETIEACSYKTAAISTDTQLVRLENESLQGTSSLDAKKVILEKSTMVRIDEDTFSSECSSDMISKYEAKFGPMAEVDESDQAVGFLNRFLALKAGGHFPNANLDSFFLPEPVISVDEDSQACVEVDLVLGYVKKELFGTVDDKDLVVDAIMETKTSPFIEMKKAVSDERDDDSHEVRIEEGDMRDDENVAELQSNHSEMRQEVDETPQLNHKTFPEMRPGNHPLPSGQVKMKPNIGVMLPVFINSRIEKEPSINRNESDTDDLSVVSSLSLFDFECEARPQYPEPLCEIDTQEIAKAEIMQVKKDLVHSALSLFSRFSKMEEKLLKLEAHQAQVALQKHGVVMLGWKSPWSHRPGSQLLAFSEPIRASEVCHINGTTAAASLSRRRAINFQTPQKKSNNYKARSFNKGIDLFSFKESMDSSCHETKLDNIPWEHRNVRQKFLSEKSIETRNWFGSLVMTRGNDRNHQPVSHPSSAELDWKIFPYPGSWEENWFTPWQAYRVNPNNLLIDQKISNDSEDSEDLVSERPQIGVMVTVRQNVNESLTRVSFMHSSNLRRSRWRKKFYPYGAFPF